MPRAETRDGKGDARASAAVTSDGVLHQVVTSLMARLEGSPLMRRAPVQSSPVEQEQLIAQLSALADLRVCNATLDGVPDMDLQAVEEVWPELAALLAPPVNRNGRRPAGAQGSTSATTPANGQQQPPAAQPAPVVSIPAEDEVAFVAPRARAHSVAGAPVVTAPAVISQSNGNASRDLGEAMCGVLRTDTRPWSASRIAARLQEVDPLATREEVYDTLYHRADLFRKTGHGWELTSR